MNVTSAYHTTLKLLQNHILLCKNRLFVGDQTHAILFVELYYILNCCYIGQLYTSLFLSDILSVVQICL